MTALRRLHEGYLVVDIMPRLHEAAAENDSSLLRRTLRQDSGNDVIDVNTYYEGETALHVACRLGHSAIASTLIEHGADVWAPLQYRHTRPLAVAIENRQHVVACVLIDKGKCLQPPPTGNGQTQQRSADEAQTCGIEALLKCAEFEDNKTYKYILDQRCLDVNRLSNQVDRSGWNPLLIAVNYSRFAMVKALLEAGADPNVRYPLHLAVHRQQHNIVKLLLKYKVDVNAFCPTTPEAYPIIIAVQMDRADIAATLLRANCKLDVQSAEGKTALNLACEQGYLELVRLLLNAGADPNLPTFSSQTSPLISAMTIPIQALYINPNKPIPELVLRLIQGGADVNRRNADGISPLQFAIDCGYYEVALMLLAADCNIEQSILGDMDDSCSEDDEDDLDPYEAEIIDYCRVLKNQGPCLTHLCVRAIRSSIVHRPFQKAIEVLPLPNALKGFLKEITLQNIQNIGDISVLSQRILQLEPS